MVSESGSALAAKLGIKDGSRVALIGAPPGLLADRPPGVVVTRRLGGHCDVIVAFCRSRAILERRIDGLSQMIYPAGGLWLGWPKRTSEVQSDLSDNVIREVVLPLGLVDNKVCAVNDTWSALRVVWRLERRGVLRQP